MTVHGKIIKFLPYVYAPSREESRFKEFSRRSQMRQVISHAFDDRTPLYKKSAYALCICIVFRESMTIGRSFINGLLTVDPIQ